MRLLIMFITAVCVLKVVLLVVGNFLTVTINGVQMHAEAMRFYEEVIFVYNMESLDPIVDRSASNQ